MTSETRIQALLLARIPVQFPQVRVWRANTGAVVVANRMVRFGLPGQADITGAIGPTGRRIEIEVKSETGRLSPEQVAFGEWMRALGALYIVAKPPRGSGESAARLVLEHVTRIIQEAIT